MTASLSPIPRPQFCDGNGVPLVNGKIYTYIANSSTAKATYTTYLGDIEAPWPLVLDDSGRTEIWLKGIYKIVLTDQYDDVVYTVDGVGTIGESMVVTTTIGSTNSLKALDAGVTTYMTTLGYRQIGDSAGGSFYWDSASTATGDDSFVVVPVSAPSSGRWLRVYEGVNINVMFYGAKGTGTDNDTPYFTLANTFAAGHNLGLFIPNSTFLLSTEPTLTVPTEFSAYGVLTWSGYNLAINPVITDNLQHFSLAAATDYPEFPAGTLTRPEWFGAKVNATDDDTLAMQACINSVSNNGGKIKLPSGTTMVSDSYGHGILEVKDNIELCGEGNSSIIKVMPSGANALGVVDVDSCGTRIENVYLHDFVVDGDRTGIGIYAVADKIRIENISSKNSEIGIKFIAGTDVDIVNNSCTEVSCGIDLLNVAGGNVRNNTVDVTSGFAPGSGFGIFLAGNSGLLVEGNRISGPSDATAAISNTDLDFTCGINFLSGFQNEIADSTNHWLELGPDLRVQINGDATVDNKLKVGSDALVDGNATVIGNWTMGDASTVLVDTTSYTGLGLINGDATVYGNVHIANKSTGDWIWTGGDLKVDGNLTVDGTTSLTYNTGMVMDTIRLAAPDTTTTDTVYHPLILGGSVEGLEWCTIDSTAVGSTSSGVQFCVVPANSLVTTVQMNAETTIYFTGGATAISLGYDPQSPKTGKYGSFSNPGGPTKNLKSSALISAPPITPAVGDMWYVAKRTAETLSIYPTIGQAGNQTGTWTGRVRVRISYWHLPDLQSAV